MSERLERYREMRNFGQTPEPRGRKSPSKSHDRLHYYIQRHDARRLHYDFRLELDGALKSWAVPKGPSLNPEDKRLGGLVGAPPRATPTFEGTIPEGNYGAGTVMVWDEGTYCARQTADREEGERLLREGLRKGHLSF